MCACGFVRAGPGSAHWRGVDSSAAVRPPACKASLTWSGGGRRRPAPTQRAALETRPAATAAWSCLTDAAPPATAGSKGARWARGREGEPGDGRESQLAAWARDGTQGATASMAVRQRQRAAGGPAGLTCSCASSGGKARSVALPPPACACCEAAGPAPPAASVSVPSWKSPCQVMRITRPCGSQSTPCHRQWGASSAGSQPAQAWPLDPPAAAAARRRCMMSASSAAAAGAAHAAGSTARAASSATAAAERTAMLNELPARSVQGVGEGVATAAAGRWRAAPVLAAARACGLPRRRARVGLGFVRILLRAGPAPRQRGAARPLAWFRPLQRTIAWRN